jgi:ornithine cyclodeaminase
MDPIWITEADVVALMDLTLAIGTLEAGLVEQARGAAANMSKTHVSWGPAHSTLHAIGAIFEGEGITGCKSWAHTEGGATPLLTLLDAKTGVLLAIIEAFALGQMRTGGISGVATRWMARTDARDLALIGTGKQALAQLAAVAAVRPLKRVRIWGRNPERRAKLIEAAYGLGYDFEVEASPSIPGAVRASSIITLATRTTEPILTATMVAEGAHINAIGAITPEREEFAIDILPRAGIVVADDPVAARKLSKEFRNFFEEPNRWNRVTPLCNLVANGVPRANDCDLSVFKAMGMGVSDLALGIEILRRAREAGLGRPIDLPKRCPPRLEIHTEESA